jgi:peptidoglycan/xylan/chitin deacetylase (PgdA/CDA1 family)
VLMLHHVEPAPLAPPTEHPDSYLTPKQLEDLLDVLDRGGFRTLTLAEAARLWHRGRTPPRGSVVLTFDDGCRCFLDHALPLLTARGHTATLFALAGKLGGTDDWDAADDTEDGPDRRRETLLTAEELREVAGTDPDHRRIEIGCHGFDHRSLPECSDAELVRETAGARAELERVLSRPVRTFCYPWGRSGPRVRAAVRAAGFLAAAGIEDHPGAALDDPWGLPRTTLRPGDSRFETWLKVSGWYRWWKRLPRFGLLAALRRRKG